MTDETYRTGGLLRCCVMTLHEERNPETKPGPAREGQILPCNYCPAGLVFRQGAWEWDGTENG